MTVNLPTDLLRSFVAIVDHGSMVRACEQICLTQSAISLQMKRLEKLVCQDLFRRNGRSLALTRAGAQMVPAARRMLELNDQLVNSLDGADSVEPVKIGLIQDLADGLLPAVLGRFAAANRAVALQVRVGGTPDLLRALRAGEIDLAMGVGQSLDPSAVHTVPMLWMGKQHLVERDELPVALLQAPCIFREQALAALEAARRPYRVVLETPHLSGLRAAVQAGIGITCRTRLMVDDDTIEALPGNVLPPLPLVAYTLHAARSPSRQVSELAGMLAHAGTRLE